MRDRGFTFLILLLIVQLVATAGIGDRLVLCIGPQGHVAIEQADHDTGCDHGCSEQSGAEPAVTGVCESDHSCTDIILAFQLTHRLPTDRTVTAPPVMLTAILPKPAREAMPETSSRRGIHCDSRGSPPSSQSLRTVVLRL